MPTNPTALTCPPPPLTALRLTAKLCVGFGCVVVRRNGKEFWRASANLEWEDAPTLRKFENAARKEPDAIWEVEFYAPLSGATYRRIKGAWLLIDTNQGFA